MVLGDEGGAMEAKELYIIALNIIERMTTGELPRVMFHQDLVKSIEREAQEGGRRIWICLSYVIHLLVIDCKKKLLWRNCFSLKGVHGKGSKRQLEYHPEHCENCMERINCITNETVRSRLQITYGRKVS